MKRICVYIATLSILLCSCNVLIDNNKKPNVIIVLTDNQGWGDVGFHGNEIIYTPRLDKLASKSTVLDRFYVSPVSSNTHVSILTGKYYHETDYKKKASISEVFSKSGYRTMCFGKWFLSDQDLYATLYQGFDSYQRVTEENTNKNVKSGEYLLNTITDSVLSYISSQNEPYFLYLAYNIPYKHYKVEDKLFAKYKNKSLDDKTATIYSMYENLDYNIGKVIDKLKELKQFNNTIFIYTSSCGPNYLRYNGGYKGKKAQVDEGSIRVPFIISYPEGGLKNRIIKEDFITQLDLFPTLLSLCNIENPYHDLDGIDVSDFLKNNKSMLPEREFYSCLKSNPDSLFGAVRTKDYLLTIYPWDTALFRVITDSYQKNDISNDSILLTRELLKKYCQWYTEINGGKLTLDKCLKTVDAEHQSENEDLAINSD